MLFLVLSPYLLVLSCVVRSCHLSGSAFYFSGTLDL